MEEIKIAYHDYRMLIIDVNEGNLTPPWIESTTSIETADTEFRWGVGNRAGLFIAMDLGLSSSELNQDLTSLKRSHEILPSIHQQQLTLSPPLPPSTSSSTLTSSQLGSPLLEPTSLQSQINSEENILKNDIQRILQSSMVR